jgi:hypothetical protein
VQLTASSSNGSETKRNETTTTRCTWRRSSRTRS